MKYIFLLIAMLLVGAFLYLYSDAIIFTLLVLAILILPVIYWLKT